MRAGSGIWISSDRIISEVIGTHHAPRTALVRVHVHHIRRKLGDCGWCVRAELALREGDAALALEIIQRLYATTLHLQSPADVPWLALVQGEALAALGRLAEAEA